MLQTPKATQCWTGYFSTSCCNKVDSPTWSLPQCIRGNAWGHVGDGDDVAPGGGCRGGGGAPILDLNGEESLHVRVCLSLGDLLSGCSPLGAVLLWVTVGMHIFFSWMPRPTHGVLRLVSCRQRFASPSSWLRCDRCVRCGVSRCAEGCCCVCEALSGSGEVGLAAAAGGRAVPQRSSLQRCDVRARAGLCELAHSITYRVGLFEMFQYGFFLLRCCKDITQIRSLRYRKTLKRFKYITYTKSLDPLHCSLFCLLLHPKSPQRNPFPLFILFLGFVPDPLFWLTNPLPPHFTVLQLLVFGLFRTCFFHSWKFLSFSDP